MTGSAWGLASLLLLHLGAAGALPREVPTSQVQPYAVGAQPVRVLILRQAHSITLRAASAAVIEDGAAARVAVVSPGAEVRFSPSSAGVTLTAGQTRLTRPVLRFAPVEGTARLSGTGGWGTKGAYTGVIEVRPDSRGLSAVEETDLESYIAGVVAAEVPPEFPLEAMAAQAIAARTYTLFHLGDHLAEGADLCSHVHCQAYAGAPSPTSRAARATEQTAGEVLTWNGVLVDALYHAACGGSTVAAWETKQGKLLPYLCGAADRDDAGSAFCGEGHIVTWSRRLTRAEAQRLVSRNLGSVTGQPGLRPGSLLDLQVETRESNRVQWLRVRTSTGTYRVRGDSIRWLFGTGWAGPSGLRSNRFSLAVERDRRGQPKAFVFRGAGHGHGIGLCQWGARGRALAGQAAVEILTAYYPGANVVDLRSEPPPVS